MTVAVHRGVGVLVADGKRPVHRRDAAGLHARIGLRREPRRGTRNAWSGAAGRPGSGSATGRTCRRSKRAPAGGRYPSRDAQGRGPARRPRRAKRARSTTLDQALDLHLGGRRRSPRTEEGYATRSRHYLGDWRRRTIEEIGRDRAGVRERHRRLAQGHGRATADSVMRVLRAVYNRARREHPDLPPNPCENIDFHGPRRRSVDLAPERLRAWGEGRAETQAGEAGPSPVHDPDWGMRRTAAQARERGSSTSTWSEVASACRTRRAGRRGRSSCRCRRR